MSVNIWHLRHSSQRAARWQPTPPTAGPRHCGAGGTRPCTPPGLPSLTPWPPAMPPPSGRQWWAAQSACACCMPDQLPDREALHGMAYAAAMCYGCMRRIRTRWRCWSRLGSHGRRSLTRPQHWRRRWSSPWNQVGAVANVVRSLPQAGRSCAVHRQHKHSMLTHLKAAMCAMQALHLDGVSSKRIDERFMYDFVGKPAQVCLRTCGCCPAHQIA